MNLKNIFEILPCHLRVNKSKLIKCIHKFPQNKAEGKLKST